MGKRNSNGFNKWQREKQKREKAEEKRERRARAKEAKANAEEEGTAGPDIAPIDPTDLGLDEESELDSRA